MRPMTEADGKERTMGITRLALLLIVLVGLGRRRV